MFNLRCQSVKNIKYNFHHEFTNNLLCNLCKKEIDNQEHILQCHVQQEHIKWNHEEIKYDQIYGSLEQQIKVTILIYNLMEVRERLEDEALP